MNGAAGCYQGKSALIYGKSKVCKFFPLFPGPCVLCQEQGGVGEWGALVWLLSLLWLVVARGNYYTLLWDPAVVALCKCQIAIFFINVPHTQAWNGFRTIPWGVWLLSYRWENNCWIGTLPRPGSTHGTLARCSDLILMKSDPSFQMKTNPSSPDCEKH